MFSPLTGFLLPFRSIRLLLHPGVRAFAILPVLLNLVVYGFLAWLAIGYFDTFMQTYLPAPADGSELGWWDAIVESILSVLRPVLWVIFAAAYLLAMFFTFTLLANLIASPFNAVLAARIEKMLTGEMPKDADTGLLASIGPAIAGELGKILYFLKWAIPLLILFLIPGINAIAAILWTLFGFWFLAIEYADYPMGNHNLKPKPQRQLLSKRRFKSLGFGAGVSVTMLILGFIAMPAAVAGATQMWVDDMKGQAPADK